MKAGRNTPTAQMSDGLQTTRGVIFSKPVALQCEVGQHPPTTFSKEEFPMEILGGSREGSRLDSKTPFHVILIDSPPDTLGCIFI